MPGGFQKVFEAGTEISLSLKKLRNNIGKKNEKNSLQNLAGMLY